MKRRASSIEDCADRNMWRGIYFYFFDHQTVQNFWTEWHDLRLEAQSPALVRLNDAFVPALSRDQTQKNRTVVGVYNPDGHAVDASLRLRSRAWRARDSAESNNIVLPGGERSAQPAFYLGVNNRQFGHFLLETLARAWAWEEFGDGRVAVLQLPPLKSFGQALLDLIPELAKSVQLVNEPTWFDDILVPGPALALKHFVHRDAKDLFRRMAARALAGAPKRTDQPVYLSRSALANEKRLLHGEQRFEAFLQDQGFRIVYPEKLSIPDQITVFNTHRWIVSLYGSACHSRLFSCEDTNMLVLTHELDPNYILCDLVNDGTAHYAEVLSKRDYFAEAGIERKVMGQPLIMDVPRCLDVLRTLGLIRGNTSFDLIAPAEEEYRKLWINNARKQANRVHDEEMLEALDAIEKRPN